jgi:hypothetical protein
MSTVQAVALLHQHQRKQHDGRLIATADDYQLARRLLLKPMARLLGGGLSDPARRFFDRLEAAWARETFTSTAAKKKESNSKSSVYGWLHELHEAGIVEMVEAGHGRAPAKWRLSGKAPDDASADNLPEMQAVFSDSTCIHGHNAEPATTP